MSDLCAVEFLQPPKYARWEGKKIKKEAEGKAAVARAWEERKEERLGSRASGGQAVPANQRRARKLQPRSLARRSAEPDPGSPRTSAASASTGKVPSMMLVN